MHGRPITCAAFCGFAATWVKGNSAYTFVELLKACFKLVLFCVFSRVLSYAASNGKDNAF